MVSLPAKNSLSTWIFVFFVAAGLLAFHLRARWLPQLREWRARRINLDGYNLLPSWRADVEAGLSSDTFNVLQANANDTREGLDDVAKKQILKIMEEKNIGFDQARYEYTQKRLAENQIGPDGMPLDPKLVTFGPRV